MIGHTDMKEPASVIFKALLRLRVGGIHEFEDLKPDPVAS